MKKIKQKNKQKVKQFKSLLKISKQDIIKGIKYNK